MTESNENVQAEAVQAGEAAEQPKKMTLAEAAKLEAAAEEAGPGGRQARTVGCTGRRQGTAQPTEQEAKQPASPYGCFNPVNFSCDSDKAER